MITLMVETRIVVFYCVLLLVQFMGVFLHQKCTTENVRMNKWLKYSN